MSDILNLVERSIQSWHSITWVSLVQDKNEAITNHSSKLRRMKTIEDLLETREYWFFLTRKSFMTRPRLEKWSSNRLEDYVLLPIDYGFVNNRDCVFLSHYWRTQQHPDPDGVDLRAFIEDLGGQSWSYVWCDWSCMPQGEARTLSEVYYFKLMLTCVSMLIRDCMFEWRYPDFEPRAWILYEVAENILCHKNYTITDDNRMFIDHVIEMVQSKNANLVLEKYNYKCTNASDLTLIRGWLELLVIIVRIFPRHVECRQSVLDMLNKPAIGACTWSEWNLEIDKKAGTVKAGDKIYHFTPVFDLQVSVATHLGTFGASRMRA